jgi:hypothetical protein
MEGYPMKVVTAAMLAALAAAMVAHVAAAAPGPQCGGTVWKQMTLADNGAGVNWNPAGTSIPAIAKFQKHVWKLNDVVIERFRQASNGELVFELYDIPSSTYMNAYVPSTSCMTAKASLRKAMVGARNAFVKNCPAPTGDWQILGAHAKLTGVGFWNPVKTTEGALANGAELRPLVGLQITQGCGKF